MRITNGMMINNALRDINNNKLNLDRYNTQLSTEKRIQKHKNTYYKYSYTKKAYPLYRSCRQ